MKIRAKFKKSRYKNTDTWLDAVYRQNKDLINEKLRDIGVNFSKKRIFKDLVKDEMDSGLSPTRALNKLVRSTLFTPEAERFKENALKGLLKEQDNYKTFRNLNRNEKGRFNKYDPDLLKYEGSGVYVYNNIIKIVYSNSPQTISVGLV